MRVASKTLAAINEALISDQGARFRGLLKRTMPLADDAYRTDDAPFRSHLGASLIGRECPRELWYSFRWCAKKEFDGRMLRLFNRGHLEEPRFVALLEMIGCTVYQYDENGKQFRISGHGGHFGGSLDSVIRGCPDLPNEPILGEYKTHNDKSFQTLKTQGVLSAKWEHFVQMQIYMGKNKLNNALYMAANKNDDEIHAELVAFDPAQYERYNGRAGAIISSRTPPPGISETPGWFKCKFCDYKELCHGTPLPVKTCRSCANSATLEGGRWRCQVDMRELSEANQLAACKANYCMISEIKKK